MTPDEIRAWFRLKTGAQPGAEEAVALLLQEIAAQLAEQNQQMRDDRLQRKVWRDEDQTQTKARDAIMAGIAETQTNTLEKFQPSPRISYPGTVEHLACLIREPDGALKLATNRGDLIELDDADSAYIMKRMSPPSDPEAKPS